jgi:Phosphotransferase enzyme family
VTVSPDPRGLLSPHQRDLLDTWLPGARVVKDHSWGLIETRVLELDHAGERYILKAGGESDGHIARELRAHRDWLRPWTSIGRAPLLVNGDADAKLVLTHYLPGSLAQDSPAADDPDTYRQAGELLALLHAQDAAVDIDVERRERDKTLRCLDGPHRIPARNLDVLRAEVAAWPTPPITVVPTHGDWQTRNWLTHDGTVFAIDFGRADLRPALTDLSRLTKREFRRNPAFEPAFLDGYGADPREPEAWWRTRVREAIGIATWAHQVGDDGFEAEGLRLLDELMTEICAR